VHELLFVDSLQIDRLMLMGDRPSEDVAQQVGVRVKFAGLIGKQAKWTVQTWRA
jgi:hypothetical protein